MNARQRLIRVWLTALGCALVPTFLAACGISIKSVEPNFVRRDALRERIVADDPALPRAAADAGVPKGLRLPCRVAVYLEPDKHGWDWTPEDRAAIDAWGASLRKAGVVAAVVRLSEPPGGKGDVAELRRAAAEQGADVLLVVRGAVQTDEYKNLAAVLNLTLVGMYVVPGDHSDALCVIRGSLIDVRDGRVYDEFASEGLSRTIRPLAFTDEKATVTRARAKALAAFGDELPNRMRAAAAPGGR